MFNMLKMHNNVQIKVDPMENGIWKGRMALEYTEQIISIYKLQTADGGGRDVTIWLS